MCTKKKKKIKNYRKLGYYFDAINQYSIFAQLFTSFFKLGKRYLVKRAKKVRKNLTPEQTYIFFQNSISNELREDSKRKKIRSRWQRFYRTKSDDSNKIIDLATLFTRD